MPNGASGTAGFLEGLVGGALLGAEFRRRRTEQGLEAEERQRRIGTEDEATRIAAEDRERAQAIENEELRERFGMAFAEPGIADPLRRGVGQQLVRVGPSATERATAEELEQFSRVGAMLGGETPIPGEDISALSAAGLLDEAASGLGFGVPAGPSLEERAEEARVLTSASARGTAEGTALGAPALEIRAEEERILAMARAEGTVAGSGESVSTPVTPQEQELFDSFDLSPEMNEFVQGLSGSERQAFILDRTKRPTATEQERRAAAVLPRAEVGFAAIMRVVDEFDGAPGLSALLGSSLVARSAQSESVQKFNAGARGVITAILRVESGAAIPTAEIEDMVAIMVPQPGDKAGTVDLKLRMLRAQMGAIRNSASLVPGSEVDPSLLTLGGSELTDEEIDQMIREDASDEEIAAEARRRAGG